MKKIFLGIAVVLVFAGICFGQTGWESTYGGCCFDWGYSVAQTTDGGYIVAGIYGFEYYVASGDVYLVKTDARGDTIWTRTYGGSDLDYANSVTQTTDGGYIAAGKTYSFGAGWDDIYLVKTNALGGAIWTRTYGGSDNDVGYSVAQTTDGGYIVAGGTRSFGAGEWDVYLVKTDSLGDTIWTRTYGGSDDDFGYSVAQTTDGGYIVAGKTYSFSAGSTDVYLVKTDALGNTIWTRTYDKGFSDVGWSVAQTTDGGYIVAGWTESWTESGPYVLYSDVYLVKTDSLGDTIWTRTYGGSNNDYGVSVAQTTDGGYIVAGRTEAFGAGGSDVYIVKTNSSGDTLWTRTYGGSNYDDGGSVAQTTDGGYIVAGGTESFGIGEGDVYLVKTDSLGNVVSPKYYQLFSGWNLLSVPFNDTFAIADLFPFCVPHGYAWNNQTKEFYEIDTVTAGIGFFLISPLDTVIAINGTREATSITDTLYRGWNLIGAPSTAVNCSTITDLPDVISDIFGFDAATQNYNIADFIRPGCGYWLFTTDTLELEMP